MPETPGTAKAQPSCWWCGKSWSGEAGRVRDMSVGENRVPVCALCWMALETLRERARKGRGVG